MSVSAGRDGLCSRQPWSSVRCRCRTLSFTAAITVSSDLIVCMSKKCRARSRQRPRQANRFAWRGLCLDLARHFFDMQTIKSLLTVMAAVKLNVLHLHLTDDQGWRLQSPSRPALTDLSGATAVGRRGPGRALQPPALVVGQVQVQDVELHRGHHGEQRLDRLHVEEVPGEVQAEATPGEPRLVDDHDRREDHAVAGGPAQLVEGGQPAQQSGYVEGRHGDPARADLEPVLAAEAYRLE